MSDFPESEDSVEGNFSFSPTTEFFADNISSQSWGVKLTTQVTTVETSTARTSTTELYDEFGPPEGIEYIFVPLGVMIFVIVLSAVVRSHFRAPQRFQSSRDFADFYIRNINFNVLHLYKKFYQL